MHSIKDLKKRISIIKVIQQTTQAMQIVSAVKLRRVQEAIQNQKPYTMEILNLMKKLVPFSEAQEERSLTHRGKLSIFQDLSCLLVLFSSNRGLCGSFNTNLFKETQQWIRENQVEKLSLAFIGGKGYEFFKKKEFPIEAYFTEIGEKIDSDQAQLLASELIERYTSGKFDRIYLVYNEFKNAISQKVRIHLFLPFQFEDENLEEQPSVFMVEPSGKAILNALIEENFKHQIFRILLESRASEYGARTTAMESASQNARDTMQMLQLSYNKQRQAGITRELTEMIAGSESQKN